MIGYIVVGIIYTGILYVGYRYGKAKGRIEGFELAVKLIKNRGK